jgi:hypothetical protein
VREFQGNAIQQTANLTAPTAVVYDAGAAVKLSLDSREQATAFQTSTYILSELIPFLRDYRSARKKELNELLKEE